MGLTTLSFAICFIPIAFLTVLAKGPYDATPCKADNITTLANGTCYYFEHSPISGNVGPETLCCPLSASKCLYSRIPAAGDGEITCCKESGVVWQYHWGYIDCDPSNTLWGADQEWRDDLFHAWEIEAGVCFVMALGLQYCMTCCLIDCFKELCCKRKNEYSELQVVN